ncbi:nucleoredoxin-like isoform X2 [Belonocnema kinseyi]|uniref:nucleoredoxin-like isoform X2 n=1 Tax=Belonocnema kinseyi TaxID=2817044 RepID=UPI00143D26BF|nr:nucleoredoxin-like isoform X2 [Belonocnema kinseyi]
MAECASKLLSSSPTTPVSKKSVFNAKTTPWQQRLFGKQLIKCSQVNQDSKPCEVNSVFTTEDCRCICEVIGVYFSFINPGATCDDFTRHLTELYNSVNGYNQDNGTTEENQERIKRKKFEIVHVVLWSNVADVLDFEESFKNHVAELPWVAVPNQDYERKCPPCKAFTPQLVDTYQRIRERGHNFEVIFVSSDRSEESYNIYTGTMPWLRIPFSQDERRQKLARALDVQAIPTLVILDPRDNIITLEGRAELLEDPEGLNFPWTSRLVNILTEKYATSLHDAPAIILFVEGEDCEIQFGETVLLPAADAYRRDRPDYDPNFDDLDDMLQFHIALDCETSDILREFVGLDDAVPLLTAIDIPRGVYAVMEDGAEITVDSVQQFVDRYRNNKLPVNKIAAVHKSTRQEKITD